MQSNFISNARIAPSSGNSNSENIEVNNFSKMFCNQSIFAKQYNIITNSSRNLYFRVNFTKNTAKGFPLIAISQNTTIITKSERVGNIYKIITFKNDFYSYFSHQKIHYLQLNKSEYVPSSEIYLTVLYLLNFSESNQINLFYTIDLVSNDEALAPNCSTIWQSNECEYSQLIFESNQLDINENYHYDFDPGESKLFTFNSSSQINQKENFKIKASTSIIFLLFNKDTYIEKETLVDLNVMQIYYSDSFETNLSISSSSTIPSLEKFDSFILFSPWDSKSPWNSVNIIIFNGNNKENHNNGLSNQVYTIITMGLMIFLIGTIMLSINAYIRCKRREQRRRVNLIALPNKLNQEVINKYFPEFKYEKFKFEKEKQECSVCLQEFTPEEACRQLFCFHLFHKECIDAWLILHENCPFCRKEVKTSNLDSDKAIFEEKLKEKSKNRGSHQDLLAINTLNTS